MRGALGSKTTLAPVGDAPTRKNAFADLGFTGDQARAGGEMQGGKRRWFLNKNVPAAERDVLDVIDGLDAPQKLRIVSLVNVGRRTVHHIEVICETYTGELP